MSKCNTKSSVGTAASNKSIDIFETHAQGGQTVIKYNFDLYLGADVSDKLIELFGLSADGRGEKRWQIANNRKAILEFCDSIQDPSRTLIAMETGTHSAWQSELLEKRGFKVVVGNARKLAAVWMNKNKSDREDAEMLARLARSDIKLFCPIRHISTPVRADLAVIKMRHAVSKSRTLLMNAVKGTLRSFGVDTSGITADNFTREASKVIPAELRPAMTGMLAQIRALQLELKDYDRKVTKLNKKYPDSAKVGQPGGVGELTALAYVLIIEDPKRFDSGDRVGKYLGITPKRDQSGSVDKQLGITKEGNNLLRWLLIQSANYIMGRGPDCDLRRFGERIAARGGKIAKRKAKVAVARKLAKLLHKLWITGEVYDPDYKAHCKEARQKKEAEKRNTAAMNEQLIPQTV